MIKIVYDKNRLDGMPKKCLDISLAKKYGWKPINDLDKGFDITLKDFLKNSIIYFIIGCVVQW